MQRRTKDLAAMLIWLIETHTVFCYHSLHYTQIGNKTWHSYQKKAISAR